MDCSSAGLVFSIDMPLLTPDAPIETGVRARGAGIGPVEADVLPSPSLTSVSTALSKFPFELFKISELRLLSLKPISLKVPSFVSKLLPTLVIFIPKTWLGLFLCGLSPLADLSLPLKAGEIGGVKRSCFDLWKVELALRRLNPNFLPGFGGKGGGSSLQEPVPVLPVFCRNAGAGATPSANVRCSYFCRMNFSIAESTISASIGMSGLVFFGL